MLNVERNPSPAIKALIEDATHYIFDVDGTLCERQKNLTPTLASVLGASGKKLAIATSRAQNEFDEIFEGSGYARPDLINGPIVLEDGGVVLYPGKSEPTLLVAPEQAAAVRELMLLIRANVADLPGEAVWGRLGDVESPLVHVPARYNYQVSGSVWQQVIDVPRNLERTMEWCTHAAERLGVRELVQLVEIGDGTLRVSVPGVSKGSTLERLHHDGAIDLSKSIYFGDGRNDLPAASAIKSYGGGVIAVDNRCPELVALADFVPALKGPRALERLLF